MPTHRKHLADNWLIIEGLLVDRKLSGIRRAGAWLLTAVYALFGIGSIIVGFWGVINAGDLALIVRLIGLVICTSLGLLFVTVAIRLTRTLLSQQ